MSPDSPATAPQSPTPEQATHGPASVAIVGGGLAGFTTAQELRSKGYTGQIRLIDPEGLPYDRPPLSKAYMNGDTTAERLEFVPRQWYADNDVEVVTAAATAIDPDAGTVTLDSGDTVEGEVIVLALGGEPRTLPIPGGDLPGLMYLRTRADADRLGEVLVEGSRVAIIGAGLIGAEITAAAVERGTAVTLIDPMAIPGLPPVGEELAIRLHAMHADHGVDVRCAMTESITQTDDGYVVHLNDDSTVQADTVLVGIGILPHTHLAQAAGLEVDQGVIVDESQRSSHPRVYAAGDAARVRDASGHLHRRHEHWENALHQGQTTAAAIMGLELPQHSVSWMWSDRYGVHVEGVGHMLDGHRVVREVDGQPVAAFRLDEEGRMIGAAAIDGGTTIRAARRIIDRGIIVDEEKLADPSVPLKKLSR